VVEYIVIMNGPLPEGIITLTLATSDRTDMMPSCGE